MRNQNIKILEEKIELKKKQMELNRNKMFIYSMLKRDLVVLEGLKRREIKNKKIKENGNK